MNQPLVSLIIRTYNEERWITSCLNAVFNQTYKNIIEWVIVEGSPNLEDCLENEKNIPNWRLSFI